MDKGDYCEFSINRFKVNKYCHYSYILIGFFIVVVFVCHVFNYKTFYGGMGMVVYDKDKYYIKCYIEYDKLSLVVNNNYISIDKNKYHYQIHKVYEDLYVLNGINYQVVDLLINIPFKYRVNNLMVFFKIPYQDKKIIKYVKDIL